MNIKLRPINENDLPFLYKLYAGTRESELEQTGWNENEKTTFLEMQFNAQHTYYQQVYAGEQFSVIQLNNFSIGRLYVGRWTGEIRIIDIALLPQYRRQGIGRKLLQDILEEARLNHKIVSLHVENDNPAISLYSQLGFSEVDNEGFYKRLQWSSS
jgi:ribosomal protein S18 acetylase RimI-like enzyme